MTAVWLHMPVQLTVGDHTSNVGTLTLGPGDSAGPSLARMLHQLANAYGAAAHEEGVDHGTA